MGFDPWFRKIPWRRSDNPLQYSCLKKSQGQRSLIGYSPWGCKDLDTPEQQQCPEEERGGFGLGSSMVVKVRTQRIEVYFSFKILYYLFSLSFNQRYKRKQWSCHAFTLPVSLIHRRKSPNSHKYFLKSPSFLNSLSVTNRLFLTWTAGLHVSLSRFVDEFLLT